MLLCDSALLFCLNKVDIFIYCALVLVNACSIMISISPNSNAKLKQMFNSEMDEGYDMRKYKYYIYL